MLPFKDINSFLVSGRNNQGFCIILEGYNVNFQPLDLITTKEKHWPQDAQITTIHNILALAATKLKRSLFQLDMGRTSQQHKGGHELHPLL